MKKLRTILSLAAFLLVCSVAQSQVQLGYVKTIGRPGKPGKPLANATVRLRGGVNTVLSGKDGSFSVTMPNKKDGDVIALTSVQKKGYVLTEQDLIGRPMSFSSRVPIQITMVSIKQLEADRQRIEKNAYKVAERNYKKKLDECQKQLKKNKITEEKYRQELNELQNRYNDYVSLISDMADRYARTDYDQLDSLDRVINICIENGELNKADSLIHTVFDPETVLERNYAAKNEIRQRIAFAQSIIDKASTDREAILRDLEYAKRVALLCENLANEYVIQGEKDKALACLLKSIEINAVLNGEQSDEVLELLNRVTELKQ